MGDDEWTSREPGSVTGSYVPPPAVPDEPPQSRPPLPRRKPQANWPRRVSGNEPPEPAEPPAQETARRASPGRHALRSANQASASTGPERHASGAGQLRLQIAQPEMTDPRELPDNVRYLFKPIMTQPVVDPVDIEQDSRREPGGEPLGGAQAGWTKGADGSSRAPAADQAAVAGRRRPPFGGRAGRRVTWAAAVLLVVVATAGTAFALIRHEPSLGSAGSRQRQMSHSDKRTGAKAIRVLSSAAIVRGQAARWIFAEISRSAIIGCDDVMCNELI